MNVALWADQHLERYGEYDALITPSRVWSNRELHDRSSRFASSLLSQGLEPGEKVLLCLPPTADLVIAFTGVLRAGGVAVILHHTAPPIERERVVRLASVKRTVTSLGDLEKHPPLAEPVFTEDDDDAQIVLTSGATGEPKGVVWRHSTIRSRYLEFIDNRPSTAPPRRSLCALPFSSSFGTQYLYLRLLQKMQLILPDSFAPESLVECIEKHRVQATMFVPSVCEALLEHDRGDLSSLKSVLVGGSDISEALIQRFRKRFGVRLTPVYGLTELGPVARDGRIREGLEVRISPDGEVEVKAESMKADYLNQESDEEWFKTGDLGYLDEQGQLHLTGRLKELILQGGVSISPGEVEEALKQLEGVDDCAVVGIPEPFLGEEMVAFVVADSLSEEKVHEHCRSTLRPDRRPTRICFCPHIPRNTLGKILRHELSQMGLKTEPSRDQELRNLPEALRKKRLRGIIEGVVRGGDLDSLDRVIATHRLSNILGLQLPLTTLFNHPPGEPLLKHLSGLLFDSKPEVSYTAHVFQQQEPIAIIGVGCRLPNTDSPEGFWDLLCAGTDFTSEITRWELPPESATRSAALADIEFFDAEFFGMTPREARLLDPQHRMVLESTWHAVEHAGYNPRELGGSKCGVYLGISGTSYSSPDPLGASPSVAAGRVCHLLNLKGPAMAIDTSCSSSAVALHTAVQNLRLGQVDLALAGGVNAICSVDSFLALSRTGALSPDGRCKSFDASADGFGRGEGCVMFLLKRKSEALRDGDNVLAFIRGTAINHDGLSSTLTAPSGPAQVEVLTSALTDADMTPGEIDYYEAHGTGTALGDPIEIEAALSVFSNDEGPLNMGSVKANVGHLEAAAGAVGVLKACYLARTGVVPPQAHFRTLNPAVKTQSAQLHIAKERSTISTPAWVAVMSMGMSGTNASLVIETAEERNFELTEGPHILCVSGRNSEAFDSYRIAISETLEDPVGNFCYTSAVGRPHFEYRHAVVGSSAQELVKKLTEISPVRAVGGEMTFLFTGQGAYEAGTGIDLYQTYPPFQAAFDQCCQILNVEASEFLSKGEEIQASTFAIEWSLYKLWESWGVIPDLVCGHSLGEYVAACVAGVFTLEEALRLVRRREELMNSVTTPGVMLSVRADVQSVLEVVEDKIEVAAINGPRGTVLSGSAEAAREVEAELDRAGIGFRQLDVKGAFHSQLMEPILDSFQELVDSLILKQPKIPMVSTVTGCKVRDEVCQSSYWVEGLRKTVQFSKAVNTLWKEGARCFLEVGPDAALTPMVAQCLEQEEVRSFGLACSMKKGRQEKHRLLEALAEVYRSGFDVDWQTVYGTGSYRRVSIPTYPFQRKRYWGAQPIKSRGQDRRPFPKVAPPHRDIRSLVESLVLRALGLKTEELPEDRNLLDAGLDSLKLMELTHRLSQMFRVRLASADVLSQPTVRGLIELLHQQPSKRDARLITLREDGEGIPLICIHPAGGRLTAYLSLREAVTDRPLYGVETDSVPESIGSAAARYVELLEKALPDGPISLFGWSLGGVIAHRMSALLEEAEREVKMVTLVDVPKIGEKLDSLQIALLGVIYDNNPEPPNRLDIATGELTLDENLLAHCEARGWLPPGRLDADEFSEQVKLYQGHVELLKSYTPPTIESDLHLIWAGNPRCTELWRNSTSGNYQEKFLDGDHYSVMKRVTLK